MLSINGPPKDQQGSRGQFGARTSPMDLAANTVSKVHHKAGIAQLGERQTEARLRFSLSEGRRFDPDSPHSFFGHQKDGTVMPCSI